MSIRSPARSLQAGILARPLPGLASLGVLLACALLAACQSRTEVSATGSTPAQFTHVFLTVNQVWFNTSAAAAPGDSSWVKFTLATPQTIDLANLNNGALSQMASSLKLAAGSYAQLLLVLADSTDALASGAHSAGAVSNDEVDYVDAADLLHTAPLAVLNAAQGIRIGASLTVAAAATTLGSTSGSAAGTASSAPSATFSAPGVTITTALVDFDATRDLVPVELGGAPAFLLNPHPKAYDAKYSGTIQGAVSAAGISVLTSAGLPDVQVSAQSLSADGTRHVIVKSTRVAANGSFILYPLSTASGAPGSYDLVIHGPTIQTVIIKSVPVTNATPSAAAALLGTLTLSSAPPFLVNVNGNSPANPGSSSVGFYQTLPLASEVPYLVETRALDPTSGVLASDQALSGGGIQYGTYVAGGTITLTAANPTQGAATYAVGAINPAYGTAALGSTVTAPASATTTALFTMAPPPLPTGSTANAISGTVTVASTQTFDHAELFLTQGGALVSTASLDTYLSSSGHSTLQLNAVAPGGSATASFAAGVYNAEVWAWNSANPLGTLTRIPYGASIDLSAGNASGVALNIP